MDGGWFCNQRGAVDGLESAAAAAAATAATSATAATPTAGPAAATSAAATQGLQHFLSERIGFLELGELGLLSVGQDGHVLGVNFGLLLGRQAAATKSAASPTATLAARAATFTTGAARATTLLHQRGESATTARSAATTAGAATTATAATAAPAGCRRHFSDAGLLFRSQFQVLGNLAIAQRSRASHLDQDAQQLGVLGRIQGRGQAVFGRCQQFRGLLLIRRYRFRRGTAQPAFRLGRLAISGQLFVDFR
jgi:hypothetical protein